MTSRRLIAGLMVALAGTVGCAPNPFAPSASDEKNWTERRSEHFVLRSDLSRGDSEELIGDLERAHWVFNYVVFPYPNKVASVTHVVAFADLKTLEPLGHVAVAGLFSPHWSGLADLSFLLLPGGAIGKQRTRETTYHELCHRFVHQHLPSAPIWLNEGLAEYYSTMEVDEHQVTFGHYLRNTTFADNWGIGAVNRYAYALIPRSEVITIDQLRQLDRVDFYAERREEQGTLSQQQQRALNYVSAWAAVHTLLSVPDGRQRFARYLDLQHQGQTETWAFDRAYGDFSSSMLDAALRKFVGHAETDVVKHEITRPKAPPATSYRLSPARVQLTLSAVVPNENDADRDRALDRALALDPNDPEVLRARGLRWLEAGKPKLATPELEKAHRVAPLDPRFAEAEAMGLLARWTSGDESPDLKPRLESLIAKLTKQARTASQFNTLAQMLFEVRRNVGGARHFVRRALSLEPGCARCFDTLALTHAARGDWKSAFESEARAVNLLPESSSSARMRTQLEFYRERLRNATAARAASESD